MRSQRMLGRISSGFPKVNGLLTLPPLAAPDLVNVYKWQKVSGFICQGDQAQGAKPALDSPQSCCQTVLTDAG